MKKLLAILLCLILLLCGCGQDAPDGTTGNIGGNGGNEQTQPSGEGQKDPADEKFSVTTADALKYQGCFDQDMNRRIGLKDDGTTHVFVANGYSDHEKAMEWTDMQAVEISVEVLYGLKNDGTLTVLCPSLIQKKLDWDYSAFTDLIQIETSDNHAVYGLKKDGTVVATGNEAHDVSGWTDVVLLSAGGDSTNMIAGLRSDGTVLIAGDDAVLDAAQWTNIVHISAGRFHVAGVRSDGTVVTVGRPLDEEKGDNGEFDVSGWTDIVYVVAENQTTYGLKSDGTVVATGRNAKDTYAEWTDILCIYPGFNGLVGLKSDGMLSFIGSWVVFEP